MISAYWLEGPYSFLPKLVGICLGSRVRNLRSPEGTCHVDWNPFRLKMINPTKPTI
jgi:hypothetical protein